MIGVVISVVLYSPIPGPARRPVVFSKAKLYFWTWTRVKNDFLCEAMQYARRLTAKKIIAKMPRKPVTHNTGDYEAIQVRDQQQHTVFPLDGF